MYLGIDIGTSSVKVVLINKEKTVIDSAEENLTLRKKDYLCSEQNPEDWIISTYKAIRCIKKSSPMIVNSLCSIGLTGQMHGAVCINKDGKVIYSAILWNDGRSYKECDFLVNNYSDYETVGCNKLMPGFTAPKLLWLKKNKPLVFQKIYKVLLPKDYLRFKLTGEIATDTSDASGTLWLDIKNRKWSRELLSFCSLSEKQMPLIYESSECTGYLLNQVKDELGLKNKIKVVAGAADNAAGALSVGAYDCGNSIISLGTSGVYLSPTPSISTNINKGLHVFCHAVKNRWYQMGVMLSAASCVSWWNKNANTDPKNPIDLIAEKYNSSFLPVFLPYLSGERTPYNDPFARGSFVGISQKTTIAEMAQSILEGVAFAIADCEDAITETGTKISNVSVIGGGSNSLYWGKIIASVLNRKLIYHKNSNIGAVFGAALLAMYEDNSTLDLEKTFELPQIDTIICPDKVLRSQLNHRRCVYIETYHSLKEIFKKQ
jgi:xylulokinase